MDMKKLLSIVDNSGTNQKTVITEGKNMAMDMVMQQYSKPQQSAPKFKSKINEYFKIVDNEMLNALQEEKEAKKIEVKKIVDRVLTRMDESKTIKATAPKPRNFVAKNATTSGAGAHKDKKKAEKQGDVKHKKQEVPMDEGHYRRPGSPSAYDRDYRSSVSGMGKRDSLAYQLDGGANDEGWGDEPYQHRDDKPVLKGYYFYDVKPGQESEAAIYGVKQTKSGKWAKALYSTSGRSYEMQKDGADKAFGPGKFWSPKKESISEKAVSKKQQKFMGMVHAAQKGEPAASPEVAKVAKGMGKKDAKDFASTKHKGLPEKKKTIKESYGSVEVGAPVKVYSNVLKKAVFGKVVKLKEGRAYVQYNNTKIVMGHPIETVQLNEADAATTAANVAGKAAPGMWSKAARFLPGLGAVASGYDAYDRIKKGDYAGAALSGLAGAASFVPVVGTAASLGLTAAQMGRDYQKKTGMFAPGEEDAAKQAATPAPGAMTPNPAPAAAPTIKDPKAMQKELIAVGADLGPTGADGQIGKFTKAAMADPKYAEIVKKYTVAPTQTATPAPSSGSPAAAGARTVAPAAAAVAKQALK